MKNIRCYKLLFCIKPLHDLVSLLKPNDSKRRFSYKFLHVFQLTDWGKDDVNSNDWKECPHALSHRHLFCKGLFHAFGIQVGRFIIRRGLKIQHCRHKLFNGELSMWFCVTAISFAIGNKGNTKHIASQRLKFVYRQLTNIFVLNREQGNQYIFWVCEECIYLHHFQRNRLDVFDRECQKL